MSKIWDPYLGISGMWKSCKKPVCNGAGAWVMVSDPYIRWRVRGSPWIWNRWYSNIDFHIESLPGAFPESDIHRTVFTLNGSNGRWIEGELEAFLNITPFTKAGFWTHGSWLDVTGYRRIKSVSHELNNHFGNPIVSAPGGEFQHTEFIIYPVEPHNPGRIWGNAPRSDRDGQPHQACARSLCTRRSPI